MKKRIKKKIASWLSSAKDLTPTNRKELARLPVLPRKRGRKGYVVKIVYKLISYIFHRLRKLTSTKRIVHLAARDLRVFIRYRAASQRLPIHGPIPGRKLRVRKLSVPLKSVTGRGDPYIDYWHHLKKEELKLQVVRVCKRFPRRLFATAQYIGLEATHLVPCHISKWIQDTDMKEIEVTTKKLVAEGRTQEEIIYQPTEFMDICDDHKYPTKIPLRKQAPIALCQLKTKRQRIGAASDVKIVFQRKPKGATVGERRLRQTRIEEFFKPRAAVKM